MRHAGYWQNDKLFVELFEYMKREPGGSTPSKTERMLEKYSEIKKLKIPPYVQVEGYDPEIVKLACKNGYMPGVTYSVSPTGRYQGRRISHMVSLVHADSEHFVILDNNYIGEDKFEWMSEAEFKRAGGTRWAIILLTPGCPPIPKNGGLR